MTFSRAVINCIGVGYCVCLFAHWFCLVGGVGIQNWMSWTLSANSAQCIDRKKANFANISQQFLFGIAYQNTHCGNFTSFFSHGANLLIFPWHFRIPSLLLARATFGRKKKEEHIKVESLAIRTQGNVLCNYPRRFFLINIQSAIYLFTTTNVHVQFSAQVAAQHFLFKLYNFTGAGEGMPTCSLQ